LSVTSQTSADNQEDSPKRAAFHFARILHLVETQWVEKGLKRGVTPAHDSLHPLLALPTRTKSGDRSSPERISLGHPQTGRCSLAGARSASRERIRMSYWEALRPAAPRTLLARYER